jgi:hypothetical protein
MKRGTRLKVLSQVLCYHFKPEGRIWFPLQGQLALTLFHKLYQMEVGDFSFFERRGLEPPSRFKHNQIYCLNNKREEAMINIAHP